MDMQCDLLISDFKNPTTISLVEENIGNISDGSSSHCASALKLGFKKAFELKKQNSGVLLQCPNTDCAWHSNHVSYTSVGSATYCSRCLDNYRYNKYGDGYYNMQCAGCGYQRACISYTSCQGCKRKFL